MNNVTLIGRLTKDPEFKYIPRSQTAVANFTLAVDRPMAKEKTADFIRGRGCACRKGEGVEMTDLGYWTDDALVASEITEKFWAAVPGIYIKIEDL